MYTILLSTRLSDITVEEACVFILIACVVISIGSVIIKGMADASHINADDDQPAVTYDATIIEKGAEKQTLPSGATLETEWVIFEDAEHQRHRVRNVKPQEFILAVGDTGRLTIQGNTIYGFTIGEKAGEDQQ